MIIEAKGLCKKYSNFELRNVDIMLPEGYILGLVGPNGAGKTTTIKMLMNLVDPDSGHIKLFGMRYDLHNEDDIKQRIGYVGEEQIFYDEMSVKWTADFVRHFYAHWENEIYRHLIKQFKIDEDKKVGELSKGNRVKLALALALAHKPDLLILDEPTSGLDPIVRYDILKLLMDVVKDGRRAVLFSTHITEDLDKIADYIVILNEGNVLVSAEKDDLLARTKKVHITVQEFERLPRNLFLCYNLSAADCIAVTKDFPAFVWAYKNMADKSPQAYGMGLNEIMLAYVKGEV